MLLCSMSWVPCWDASRIGARFTLSSSGIAFITAAPSQVSRTVLRLWFSVKRDPTTYSKHKRLIFAQCTYEFSDMVIPYSSEWEYECVTHHTQSVLCAMHSNQQTKQNRPHGTAIIRDHTTITHSMRSLKRSVWMFADTLRACIRFAMSCLPACCWWLLEKLMWIYQYHSYIYIYAMLWMRAKYTEIHS